MCCDRNIGEESKNNMSLKSMYDIIKRQNGEAFARRIRKFDSSIFEIENLPDILKYAGRNPEPLLEYLESLKNVQVVENNEETDPFLLLDKAGYNAYLADTLEKQNAISKYFEKEEMICTFKDAQRYQSYHIIHAVKKNVEEIKRSDFPKPRREDDYGTSVISIQILKVGGFIKITNRYNHTVEHPDNTFYSNPDEIIKGLSCALKKYFDVDFSSNRLVLLPEGYFLFKNQILKYYKEENNTYIGEGFYLKDGQIHLVDKNSQLQVDEFIIDLKNKEILNPSGSDNPLKKVLEQEIFSKTLQVKNNNGVLLLFSSNGEILKVKNGCLRELTLYETQKLPEFFLNRHPWIEKVSAPLVSICLKEGFRECPNLKEIDFKELKSFDFSFCADTRCQIKAKTLEEKGVKFFDSLAFDLKSKKFINRGYFREKTIDVLNRVAKNVSVKEEGDSFHILSNDKEFLVFKNNKLTEIYFKWYVDEFNENYVFLDMPDVEVFSAESMTVLGENNLIECPNLRRVYLKNMLELKGRNLSHCESLEYVYAPELLIVGRNSFSHNKNYKKASFKKLYKVSGADCFSNSGYEELDFPNLVYAGRSFCSNNPFLVCVRAENLRNLSEYSFSNLDLVEELDFKNLQYIEGRNLIQNNPMLKRITFEKLMTFPDLCLKDCPLLEEAYLTLVYRLDSFLFKEKKNFKYFYAPNLNAVSQEFLSAFPVTATLERGQNCLIPLKILKNNVFSNHSCLSQLERGG